MRKCNPEYYGYKSIIKGICVLLVFLLTGFISFGQNVPYGIFYQAVARDNMGKELD